MTEKSVLVVAFDGLDKELIEEFDLEYIPQQEFGGVDNTTGMSKIKTSELFASFITGENYEEHGIKGLNKEKPLKGKILDKIFPSYILNHVRGTTRLKDTMKTALGYEQTRPTKKDLKCETLFEEIENSKALFVPSYNPSVFWSKHGTGFELRNLLAENQEPGYIWDIHEHAGRKEKLFRPISRWHTFCMVHFHRADAHQHFYGDPALAGHDIFDKQKLEKLYGEIDTLAGKIIEYFKEDYDFIIFMSDHGLPTEDEHNRNAFYSCNKELFPNQEPCITNFYNKILELSD